MTAQSPSSAGAGSTSSADGSEGQTDDSTDDLADDFVDIESDDPAEHFRPTGTLFILGAFVLTLILLWLSVYVILISRGVTT